MPSTSSYPGAIDSFENPPTTLGGPPTHEDVHRHLADAAFKLETELGTNPSGTHTTVASRFTAIENLINADWQTMTPIVTAGGSTVPMASATMNYLKVGRIGMIQMNGVFDPDSTAWPTSGAFVIDLPTGWVARSYGGTMVGRLQIGGRWRPLYVEVGGGNIVLFRYNHNTSTDGNETHLSAYYPNLGFVTGDAIRFGGSFPLN